MNSKTQSGSFHVTDVAGNRVGAPGKIRWTPHYGFAPSEDKLPFKWELVIPHFHRGERGETYELGALHTDIEVYRSGKISWPGKDIPPCATKEEAMAFVETAFALEFPDEVA